MFDSVIETIVTQHNGDTLEDYANDQWNNTQAFEMLMAWCETHQIMIYLRIGTRKSANKRVELRHKGMKVASVQESLVFAIAEAVALAWLGDFTAVEEVKEEVEGPVSENGQEDA